MLGGGGEEASCRIRIMSWGGGGGGGAGGGGGGGGVEGGWGGGGGGMGKLHSLRSHKRKECLNRCKEGDCERPRKEKARWKAEEVLLSLWKGN